SSRAHLCIGGWGWIRWQADRYEEFAIGQCKMGFAILNINLAQGNSAGASRASNIDFGAKHQQGGRKIAAERGVAALSLRSDMADVPAAFKAISIGVSPPFALIVVDAARIEAQIAADRSH